MRFPNPPVLLTYFSEGEGDLTQVILDVIF